jgi:predicted kinase
VDKKVMILMRGLPSSGKSYTSRELARNGGILIEFDEFFYRQVGGDPSRYDWSRRLMPLARHWNFERIRRAVLSGITPIIVDSDNDPDPTTRRYVACAVRHGYAIHFKEPDSPWWRRIRVLLGDPEANRAALDAWAAKLAAMNRGTHRVPLSDILRRIKHWRQALTVDDFLNLEPAPAS